MKSHPYRYRRSHLLIAWVALLLIPLCSAQPQKDIEISQFPFQESFEMSSSDQRFYRLGLSNALPDLGLTIYMLPEQGSDSPKLFVSHSKEFPQTINDADYSSISNNVVFINHKDLKHTSNLLYIGLLCESPKCNAKIVTEWAKEILVFANGEKTNETPNSLNGARSAVARLTIPKESDVDRIVIHIDAVAVSRTELPFLEVSINQGTSLPLTNIPRRSSWFEGKTIVIGKDSDLFCTDCIYTLNLKFSGSSSLSLQALTFQKKVQISRKTRLDGVLKGKENSHTFTGRKNSITEDFVLSVKVHKGKVTVFIDCEKKQPSHSDLYFWSFAVESSKDIIISQRTHCSSTENFFILVQGEESSVYSLSPGYEKSNQLFIGKASPVHNEILPHAQEEITYEILMPLIIAEEITLNLLHSKQSPSANIKNCIFATDCPGVLPADSQHKISNYYGFDENLPSEKITDFHSGHLIKINPQKSGCYPIIIQDQIFSKEPIAVCAYQVTLSNPYSSSLEFTLTAEYKGPNVLTIGEPRFDIVIKKDSLYYLLYVPHNPEHIESIQIQLTKFSGDLDIFISKTNKNPNRESHDDITLSYEGFIVINNLPDLSGAYYIGVHGLTSSTFSISATVKTKPKMTDDSAFLLTPGRPQKGVMLPKHNSHWQYYKIFLSPDYGWYGPLRITVNSLSGSVLILVNHNGEFPTPEKYQWESKSHEIEIHSNYFNSFDLKGAFDFKKQGLYYVGIFIDKTAPDSNLITDLTYYIRYSVTSYDSSNYDKDRHPNPFHTFLSLNTRFYDVIQKDEPNHFEALVPADQFPLTISKQSDSQSLILYISTDAKSKYPSQDSSTPTTKDSITLEACKAFTCLVYITANQQQEASLYSLSISSQENSLIALENDRQIQANIPANNLPARFYYHAIPSKTFVVTVNGLGNEALIYAKRIKVNIESLEKPEIPILTEKTAEFIGATSVSIPPLADSDITIVAISVYFKGNESKDPTKFTIMASSQITQLPLGTPFSADVQKDRYVYFMVNITRPECTLLVSLSSRDHHYGDLEVVISYGEETRPTISNHQFALISHSKTRLIELNNTDISPLKSMAGSWVIGVHGLRTSFFTLTALIHDRKIVDMKPGTPVEMMSLEESSSVYFKFYHEEKQNLQINLTKFSGQLNLYMTSIDSYKDLVLNLPNQTYHKWQILRVASQSIITIDFDNPQGCVGCTYLIKIEAISSSKFNLQVNHLASYISIPGGLKYQGRLKPQESTVFLLKKSNYHLDQNLLNIEMKGKELFVMGSHDSFITPTNYQWKETLTSTDLHHVISLPSDGSQKDIFYLLLENPKDKDVEYNLNIITKPLQTFFSENVERVYDLHPLEKNYFIYNCTDSQGFSADIIFYATHKEGENIQEIMRKDLNAGQKLKAKYWPTRERQQEVYLEAEDTPKSRSNSSHIIFEQKFSITNPRGKYQIEVVNLWQFNVKFRIFMRKSGVIKTNIVDYFNGNDMIQSDAPKFYTSPPDPGNWYFWLYSCGTTLDLKIENGDPETGMVTIPKGNGYLYREGIQTGPKDVWMSVNPKSPSDQGRFILYSVVFDEKELKNFELKEENLEVKVTYKNQKEDKNEVTVEFNPIELEDPESYDLIRYEIWLCPNLLELSTESTLCSEDKFRQRCQNLSLRIEKSQKEQAQVSFQGVNYGMHFVRIKATIVYNYRSIKDVEPYRIAHVDVQGPTIRNIFKMFIGINILIVLVVAFFVRQVKPRQGHRGVELQQRMKEYNPLEEREEGEEQKS